MYVGVTFSNRLGGGGQREKSAQVPTESSNLMMEPGFSSNLTLFLTNIEELCPVLVGSLAQHLGVRTLPKRYKVTPLDVPHKLLS